MEIQKCQSMINKTRKRLWKHKYCYPRCIKISFYYGFLQISVYDSFDNEAVLFYLDDPFHEFDFNTFKNIENITINILCKDWDYCNIFKNLKNNINTIIIQSAINLDDLNNIENGFEKLIIHKDNNINLMNLDVIKIEINNIKISLNGYVYDETITKLFNSLVRFNNPKVDITHYDKPLKQIHQDQLVNLAKYEEKMIEIIVGFHYDHPYNFRNHEIILLYNLYIRHCIYFYLIFNKRSKTIGTLPNELKRFLCNFFI
jgi:hypothetical protein